jgi:hypothetical protein
MTVILRTRIFRPPYSQRDLAINDWPVFTPHIITAQTAIESEGA